MSDHIVIIGNGIAGITAARHIRKKSDKKITVISAETDYFFSRTALMYIYMGHMKFEHTQPYEPSFWKKNNIELKKAYVKGIDFEHQKLSFDTGETMPYDKLILAVGSKPNKFGWPGQDAKGVQGMYSYQDLESMEEASKTTKRAVIIGGGLIGIEMAEMFLTRGIEVTFLVRENNFWNSVLPHEESSMVTRHVKEHHVDLRLKTELKEIIPDDNGRVKHIITNTGEKIECEFVGLTAGVSPNVDFLKNTDLQIEKGIMVNRQLETNQKNVFAIGDCAQFIEPSPGRRPLEQVWYTGRMMGEVVANTVCGTPTEYHPGVWFNSAKFFDIEYQIYGTVNSKPEEHEEHLYWEHEDGKKSIRIIFNKNDQSIIGFNLMGIRYRHEVCDKWLREKASITEVLTNLRAANFDPEFFKRHESDMVDLYNKTFPTNPITLKTKKSVMKLIFG